MNKKSLIFALILSMALSDSISNVSYAEYSSLSEAIHDTTTQREYSFSGIEQVTANLGTMAAGTLTVTGSDGSGILGKRNSTQYSGVTVNSGSTLIMRNIGDASVNLDTGAVTYNSGIAEFRKSGGGAIYNSGTLTLEDVVFYDNNGGGNLGSVIYNNNGHITKISGLILNNKNASGAIYNFGQDAVIDSIEADFVGNTNANHGAAILSEGNARISEIKNSHFFANSTRNSGGAIRTNVKSELNTGSEISIDNSLFRYNSSRQGGAIQNGTSSTTNINNTVFDKNYSYNADSSTKEGGGGAIYNDGNLYITDSVFKDNASTYDGGAIYSSRYINNAPDSFVNIYAKNYNVLFSNNKSKVTSVSYSESAGYSVTGGQYNDFYGTNRSGLSLSANSDKSITFNGSVQIKGPTFDVNADNADHIKGGSYNFNNTVEAENMSVYNGAEINLGSFNQADSSTSYGVLAVSNFSNDTNGGLIDTTNNHFDEQNFGSTTLNSDLNFNFDMNLASLETDTITANYSNGSGKIILSDVNLLGTKSWGDFLESDIGTKIKILNSNSNSLQLGLSSTLANTLSAAKVSFGTEEISRTDDEILATTNWEYDKYKTTILEKDKYGQWELSKTSTENDSLEFKGTENEITRYETMGDTLRLVNQDTTNPIKNFNASNQGDTYVVTENLGTTKGTVNINGISGAETINLNGKTGFELNNDDTTLTLKDVEIKNSSSLISGTAGNNVNIILDNVNLHDNGTGITTAGNISVKGNSTISDDITVNGSTSSVDIDGSDEVTLNGTMTGSGTSTLNISNGIINVGDSAKISSFETTLNNTSLNIANENSLNGLNTTFNGANNLNIANNNIGTLALGNVNLNGVLKMQVDADLSGAKMDKLTASSATVGSGGRIEVSKINLLSPTTQKKLDLLFTDNRNLASAVKYTGEGQIVYSPIYKYNTSYVQKSNGKGYFSFETPGKRPDDFNPSVMASSVTAIVTGYQNQMQALHDGFYHMERYMKHTSSYRLAAETQNIYASLSPVTSYDINRVPETSKAMWTLPYSTFERVNLKGGVKVDNIAYGMTLGGDSNMFDMGHGFKGLISTFVGYNGNHMTYNGISMTQNGGFLGGTINAYKGNFFTGLTVSTGASTGDADTMYGHDNITLLTAGVANKTGYNFEFKEGKIIVQPSLFLGYSWVNTFDYTNSAGVRIKQDALNALQIAPGLKVIGNTKSGWQPYAGIDMVWNIFMGRNQVKANDVVLPQLSERAYVQYGVGVQKTWADKFTGFLQAMIHNGGRNGIILSAGLRWTIGKDSKTSNNSEPKHKTVIKQLN